MQAEERGIGSRLTRELHLGERLPATPPHRPQPPEHRRAVLDDGRARRTGSDRASRRPSACGHTAASNPPVAPCTHSGTTIAGGMLGPRLPRGPSCCRPGMEQRHAPAARPCPSDAVRPDPLTCTSRRPVSAAEHQRRGQGQLLNPPAADLITGPHRQLQEPGPREQHHPAHRVISQPRAAVSRRQLRPVNTTPSDPASGTAAPSSGCPAGVSPADTTSPPCTAGRGQNRSRWNGYVGRSTRRAPVPANHPAHCTGTPATCNRASAVASAASSGRSAARPCRG